MGKGTEKTGGGAMTLWGIRHTRAILYLLWLFLWWYRFDKYTRLRMRDEEIDRFYDIWFGVKAKKKHVHDAYTVKFACCCCGSIADYIPKSGEVSRCLCESCYSAGTYTETFERLKH